MLKHFFLIKMKQVQGLTSSEAYEYEGVTAFSCQLQQPHLKCLITACTHGTICVTELEQVLGLLNPWETCQMGIGQAVG